MYLKSCKLCTFFHNITMFPLILKQCLQQYLAGSKYSVFVNQVNLFLNENNVSSVCPQVKFVFQ